jgi:phospholipase/lecithinase/hemolysin
MNLFRHSGRFRLLVAALVSIIAIPLATAAATAFSQIVVFGDSLNDRGNMVQFTNGAFPNVPRYTYGRQSNGAVWVEYLAKRLGMADKIRNYAVVGAMTAPAPGFPTGNVWSDTYQGLEGTDVTSQVLDYLAEANGTADPKALFILEGGANDFPRVTNPGIIISNLVQLMVALETRGAKHIMLVNLPDIGKTPRVILAEQAGYLPPGSGAYFSSACAQLNQALAAAAAANRFPDVTLSIADTYGFMNIVAANPSAFGMTNVQLPFLIFGTAAANPVTWLFWDDLHPTTRGHEIFAEQAAVNLLQAYSPSNGNLSAKGAINALHGLVKEPKK